MHNGEPSVCGAPGRRIFFIFRELRSTGKYFRGAGEHAHSLGDLGCPVKKLNNKGKATILFDFF